jgi:hypothetical protein
MPKYTIKNKAYGKKLVGRKLYYRGFSAKPSFLKDDGQGFPGGKHLLETLDGTFKSYDLILTPQKNDISKSGSKWTVQISQGTLRRIDTIVRERSRELRLDAAFTILSSVFPTHFTGKQRVETYRRGMLASLLRPALDPRVVSAEDQKAVSVFAAKIAADPKAMGFDEREAVKRKHTVQLIYLKRLIAEFEARLPKALSEGDWQKYFEEKILYFQDNYINKIHKPNVATVTTQFPDFGVITADDYLDLLEIKLPKTTILNFDKSHNNYYWSSEIAKAISQAESYIESVTSRSSDIILQIEKLTNIRLRIVKPRGLVIAGLIAEFAGNQSRIDCFRRLNEGLKNVEIVPYDELSRRLKNTILSIEKLESASKK